jgi:hypothetical protein
MLRKIYLICILTFASVSSLFAQSFKYKEVQNLLQADQKLIHFGFVLGLHTQDFYFKPSKVVDPDGIVWYGDVTSPSPGFTVGIISDLRLGEYFNARFVPTLNFGDRAISFSGYKDDVLVTKYNTSVLSTLVSMPLLIKYRALRINNYRPYLIAGGGVQLNLSRKKDQPILLGTFDEYVEFGVGCDFYLPYFKLSPELKMCLGLNDVLERTRPLLQNETDIKYTNSISKLTSRLIVLSFNFE